MVVYENPNVSLNCENGAIYDNHFFLKRNFKRLNGINLIHEMVLIEYVDHIIHQFLKKKITKMVNFRIIYKIK